MNQNLVESCYDKYRVGIFRYALSITKDPCMAEDVMHDTFVKMLAQRVSCASGKEQAWLFRVARNLCLDLMRKAKREKKNIPAQISEEEEYRYEYIELIASLSPKEQEIVTLKIVGGLSHKEIASVLGISAGAAQKRYERAIAVLRDKEE